jgi:hypothetical protein
MGSDRGTGPATSASPDYPASKSNHETEREPDAPPRLKFSAGAAIEITRRRASSPEFDAREEGEAEEIAIDMEYRQRLAGLRHLPRREKPHALRAAREWRRAALKALREKRAAERYARRLRRQSQTPAPC